MNQVEIKAGLSSIPAIVVAMLPQVFCLACWPAYTGLLSSMGIGFVNYTPYLLPVTIVLLVITMGAFAYKANKRRGYGPLTVGVMGSAFIVLGKFFLEIDSVLYLGIVILISGSIWNVWPNKRDSDDDCEVCQ